MASSRMTSKGQITVPKAVRDALGVEPGVTTVTGLDTNVLVRFLVEDDEAQTERAAALVEAAVAADERLYVSDIVLCDVVGVLGGAYGFRRSPAIYRALGIEQ